MRQIVNSRFLERPQKRSGGNQLIHRRLTRTKSIGSGQNPESGRQTARRLCWRVFGVETGRYGEDDDRWAHVFHERWNNFGLLLTSLTMVSFLGRDPALDGNLHIVAHAIHEVSRS